MTAPNQTPYRHPPRVRRLLASMVPVVCPPDAETLGLTDAIVDHFALSLGASPAFIRASFVAGALAYDEGARLWPPARGRRASALPPDRAERWFRLWWKSRVTLRKEFAHAVRSLLSLAYYEMPEVREKLGYQPEPWIERVKAYRLEVYAGDISRHQESLFAPDPLVPRDKRDAARGAG